MNGKFMADGEARLVALDHAMSLALENGVEDAAEIVIMAEAFLDFLSHEG